jgi:hypothetical protein
MEDMYIQHAGLWKKSYILLTDESGINTSDQKLMGRMLSDLKGMERLDLGAMAEKLPKSVDTLYVVVEEVNMDGTGKPELGTLGCKKDGEFVPLDAINYTLQFGTLSEGKFIPEGKKFAYDKDMLPFF